MPKPLFGPDWMNNVGLDRKPRFINGKPMLCLPPTNDEECCNYADFIHWNSRIRSGERGCYLVWEGKFLPEYIQTFSGGLEYYGQHPLEEECRGVYYVVNHITGSLDAFRRNFASGQTINQIWTAPAGMLHSHLFWDLADAAVEGIFPLGGPTGLKRMSFIEANDRVCFVGTDLDTVDFSIDPVTGEQHCEIIPGNSILQVRDAWTGAILCENEVNFYISGIYGSPNCSSAFYGSPSYGIYCGPGRGIVSATAISDTKVFATYEGGIIVRPGCDRTDPNDPERYRWARSPGKIILEHDSTYGWIDTEHVQEDSVFGNAFLPTASIHHVLNPTLACIQEPDGHDEPSHSACLYYNYLPNRLFLGRQHAGASKLSKSYISTQEYGVGSEDGGTLLVRGLPGGQVFKDLACGNGDFTYVLQENLDEGGDTQAEIDKCKAVWGDPGTPASCNSYLGDASVTITAYDFCSCSMEVIVSDCLGPCKPFSGFDWYLCLKQDCDYTEGVCTYGPVDCFTQHCNPVGSGTGTCGEPFWVPMVQAPTTLVLLGRDGCGCPFMVCKPIEGQSECDCPIVIETGSNSVCALSPLADDLVTECWSHYPPNSPGDCYEETEACEGSHMGGGSQGALYYVIFRTNCEDVRLNVSSWSWYGLGDAHGAWCEEAQESHVNCYDYYEEASHPHWVTALRCGHWYADLDCDGDAGEYWEIGWYVTVVAYNTRTGSSCTKKFQVVIDYGGIP